jgi:hypothetical protein
MNDLEIIFQNLMDILPFSGINIGKGFEKKFEKSWLFSRRFARKTNISSRRG